MDNIRESLDSIRLMERCPAECFEEAYPIGNGSRGAMIYGGTYNEKINLNDDTLWSGYPRNDRFKPGAYEALEKAKELLLAGEYTEARKEIAGNFACYGSESYLPLGDLCLTVNGVGKKVREYRRTLDLKRAVATVKYVRGDIGYSVTAFASHPHDVIVYRMEAKNKEGEFVPCLSLTAEFCSKLYSRSYTYNGLLYMDGEGPVTSEKNIKQSERKTQYYDEPEKRGVRFMAMAQMITDGKITDEFNAFRIDEAGYCEIRIFMATSYNGFDRHPFTDGSDYRKKCHEKCERLSDVSFETLLKAHIRDHSKFFNRVKLDLGSDNKANIPTSERLRRFNNGASDKALTALLFNFGRYLTIASSRQGSQAINLQGIWNDKYAAPWHSNYTVNINTEMNYFPTLTVNLAEMYEPLIRLICEVAESGRESARILYNSDGWCCHHNTDLWRNTQPVSGSAVYSFWNGAGGWLCRHLMEYYEYTLDKKFLKQTAYPIIREAVRFYLSQLITLEGYRIVFPSTSPENPFIVNGVQSSVAETSEMTMAIVRELFSNYLSICDMLGVTDDITERVKEELPQLMPVRMTSDGRIMEWFREFEERQPKHRHLSHLYSFYPARNNRPDNAPELCEACRRSLEVRGEQGTGWSISWKASLYAALWDGENAYKFVKKQLYLTEIKGYDMFVGGGVYINLLGSCPPFQIDSNFGTTAAIAEMLLQSDMDTVHIIPAIPAEWQNISVKGLRAKGNREISFSVKDGSLKECTIKGSMPSRILVCGKDMTELFRTMENGVVILQSK